MKHIPVLGLSLIVAACSHHPLVDDVAIDSFQIMQRIRCESVSALKKIIINELESSLDPDEMKLANRIKENEFHLSDITVSDLSLATQSIWNQYKDIVLAFAFTISAQENNGADGGVKVSIPFTHGTVGLSIGTENSLQRIGERKFTFAETVDELSDIKNCGSHSSKPNLVYPITGEVGMYEVLNSFFEISSSVSTISQFTDRINFVTTISGSASPKIELSSADVTEISGSLSAARMDTHQLLFTAQLPEKGGASFRTLPSVPGRQTLSGRDSVSLSKGIALERLRQEQYLINNDTLQNIILQNPQ